MTTLTITKNDPNRIWLKLQEIETEDGFGDEIVAEAVAAKEKPASGEGFWWKELNALQLGGIFNGRTEATLTINDLCKVTEVK